MSKTRVFIYGSCVSRDTFEHFDPERFELVEYVARQSVLSAYTKPVELMAPPTLKSRFQQRMITGDFSSSLRSQLATHASATDFVLVDLTDERLGAYLLPDGSIVTRSVELIESGGEQYLPQGTQHIAFGTQQHFDYWTAAVEYIGEQMRNQMSQATVVLLDIPWAEWSETGAQTPGSFGMRAADANPVFRSYARLAAQALGAHVISMEPSEVVSSPDHPWGDAPFHYAEKVYLEIVRRLTGAEGRVVWGPGAVAPATQDVNPTASPGELRHGLMIDDVLSTTWKMQRDDGSHATSPIRLNRDGTVWGTKHQNESRWIISDGCIAFATATGEASTRFHTVSRDGQTLFLKGEYLLDPKSKIVHVLESVPFDASIQDKHPALTKLKLKSLIKENGWNVGDHTFGEPTVLENKDVTLAIGKFCTIEPGVTIRLAEPPNDGAASYAFRAMTDSWPSVHESQPMHTNGPVDIGNDVWIGAGAIICSGVTIGNGAIIEPGAVVMTNVAPYGVVAGAPAREIGKRFSDAQIVRLQELRWWDWSWDRIDSSIHLLTHPDVEALLQRD
ncbi:DUF6270 domain-containing protein [Promicromonospora vindobonensis]|uniref:DUF6270 domain-containing protein n=1 Tax=Promicromonospora vindobonensis TaxID=195748 RepID=A0ABW5VYS1_9MICO